MNVEKRVLRLISNHAYVDPSELSGDQTGGDLGFDSLDDIELIMSIEEEFDIEVPDAHAEKLTTVRSVIDYVAGAI